MTWEPGHFYSPIPDLLEIHARHDEIFGPVPTSIPGIELNTERQLEFIDAAADLAAEFPFKEAPLDGLRYHYDNGYFDSTDALVLYTMLRLRHPARYVEIGSGWSSALALDVRDNFLGASMDCMFVEPFPDRLDALLRPQDHASTHILRSPLQAVWHQVLGEIGAGDVLFIDSTHVGKVGSDVLLELTEMIPRLPSGVLVHLHDIFYPFEYPPEWVYGGRYWNEAYFLRALMTNNERLRIVVWNNYLSRCFSESVKAKLPLWSRSEGGSIWLETC